MFGRSCELGVLDGGGHVETLVHRRRRTRRSLVPRTLLVPRVLNRSTATPARAGSRQAALRKTWLSIMPPWVGSGCRQTRVATGSRSSGQRQLADEGQAVGGVQLDVLPAGGQDRVRADLVAHQSHPASTAGSAQP